MDCKFLRFEVHYLILTSSLQNYEKKFSFQEEKAFKRKVFFSCMVFDVYPNVL